MALSNQPVFTQTPVVTPQSFVQGTDVAGTYKTVYTAGANGSKVVSLTANTTDGSAAHVMTVAVTRSAVTYPLVNVNLPVNSGGDGTTPAVDLLSPALLPGLPVDNDGQRYLFLKSGDTLQVTFATALTAAKSIFVQCVGADF